jgi:hypothetical protein
MSIIIDKLTGLLRSLWGIIKFIIFLPFVVAEIGIVFIGIVTVAFILWWVFSVDMPDNS